MGTLQELAIQIRDEQRKGANSSTRVGGLLLEIAKLLESSESNNIYISDLSDLDNYKMTTHRGVFNVYMGEILVGVLFIIQYQAAHHGGLQIFMSTFDYKMSGTSSLSMPSIIYRSTDYNNIEKWLEWQPYQNIFISNNGQAPSTDDPLGFNDTNVVPSLRLFLEKLAYPKVVEWSGKIYEDAEITSLGTVQVGSIVYIQAKKTFALGVGASISGGYKQYYAIFEGVEDFQQNFYDSFDPDPDFVPNFTRNIFKAADGSIWIADSASSIKMISKDAPKDEKTYGRKNGKWVPISGIKNGDIVLPDKSTLSLEEYQASGRSDAIGVVFDAHKGLFVRKNKYSGKLVGNQDPATGIFYGTVGCKDPYDGRTIQKLNLLHSSNPASDFPVFNYAEENGWYVASNGELNLISEIGESLTEIGSDYVNFSNISSCTQDPLVKSSASVFYAGGWRSSDKRNPLEVLSFFLVDIL